MQTALPPEVINFLGFTGGMAAVPGVPNPQAAYQAALVAQGLNVTLTFTSAQVSVSKL